MENGQNFSDAQIITWIMSVIGWIITMVVAWAVLRKNARNTWTGELRKALVELEDDAISFWMGNNNEMDLLELKKIRRKVKEITSLAREIKDYGGLDYPGDSFIHLRRSVTTEKYHQDNKDVLLRNLAAKDNRIIDINNACDHLRSMYKRDTNLVL